MKKKFKIIRISVAEVMSRGRISMGVKVVNLDDGAAVVACDRVDNGGTVPGEPGGSEAPESSGGPEDSGSSEQS